ncbi:MAG: peptide chain release factor N(5)-glutamine methyltransferase, partial [Candidatus Marinimicrobia bacterium]|nr:peptide chain release factor N(5)-glutamine methyltransferase [Candidatus Neomarinimicrobiota bacterium]
MTQNKKVWKIVDIIKWSTDYLINKKIDDAKVAIEWMLTDVLKCSRMELYLNFNQPLTGEELKKFKSYLLKCANHEPVQQIIGKMNFYGFDFAVDNTVLVPRPETEILVEKVIEKCKSNSKQILKILDIGSGSGAIAIALAKHLPNAKVDALEYSKDAIEILKKNINFHNLARRISVINEDVFKYFPKEKFDIIVSNPPYISKDEFPKLDKNVKYYEPPMALTDNDDGFKFYRFYAENFHNWLEKNGLFALEIGNGQREKLEKIFREYGNLEFVKDYQNDDRVL